MSANRSLGSAKRSANTDRVSPKVARKDSQSALAEAMETNEAVTTTSNTIKMDSLAGIEILDPPIKSESDKKSYR